MARRLVPVVCPYCGSGCGVYIVSEDGRYAGIEYWKEHPFNRGKLCPKGNDFSFLVSPERLKKPLKRTESGWKEISWSEAIKEVAERLKEYAKAYGADVIGFLASAKCYNEENYALQKLARILGSPNIDHCARLCHAATVHGLIRTAGAGAISSTFDQLLDSEVIFITGWNTAVTHPVIFGQYVLKAKARGAKLIVADPVLNETAMKADLFLQQLPGSDVALFLSIAHVIIRDGMVDWEFVEKYTTGFEEFKEAAMKWPPEKAEEVTGVPASLIIEAAHALGSAKRGSILWAMGVTQHINGTDAVSVLAMIAALRGWWGKPGCVIGGVRGQNNVQGACDMGCLSEFYPGYVRASNREALKRIAEKWGVDVESLPGEGLTVVEMMHAAERGKLKAMYIMGENPMVSDPNLNHVREALKRLEFLVVQDIFLTETAEYADIVLPAAAWAEKEGTFTSADRHVQWSFKALEPPGEAKPDLEIIVMVARALGLDKYLPYRRPEDVLREINAVIPAYAGITPERVKNTPGGIPWPCPSPDHPGTKILFADRKFKTPTGKFTFYRVDYRPPAETPSPDYPLILTTMRLVGAYHTHTMTGRSLHVSKRWPPPGEVLIHPETAAEYGVKDGQKVVIETRRGSYTAIARVTERVKPGVIAVPWHYGANILTNDELDPISKEPELKVAAARIKPYTA